MAVGGGGVEAMFWVPPVAAGDATDWIAPGVLGSTGGPPASGTVTSVGLALPVSVFSISGSPVTTAGTLTGAFLTQSANTVFAGPSSGGAATPAFRALAVSDLPVTIVAGGPIGSATVVPIITYNAAGQLTAVSSATITPAVGSVTGLGSGVATALGNTAGGAGGFALVGTTPPTGTAGGDLAGTYPSPTLNTSISTAVAFSGLGLTHISNATQSTNTVSGSLTTAGGLGVAKSVWVGDTLTAGSTVTGQQFVTTTAGTGYFAWGGSSLISSPANGTIAFSNNNGTNGATVSFPSGLATLQLGAANAASPVAQTLQSQGSRSGTDTNVAGSNLTIASGQGTGNATGSSLIFQTPAAVASGTGAQTMTTQLQITGTGQTVFGGTYSNAANLPWMNLNVNTSIYDGVGITSYGNTAFAAGMDFYKTRNAAASGSTTVQSNDKIIFYQMFGNNGASYQPAGYFQGLVDGVPSSTSMPGRWEFYTTPSGSNVPVKNFVIDQAGIVTLGDNAGLASPLARTLQAQGSRAGTDSNVGGAQLTLQPGTGTGTGPLAALITNSPIVVASGSGAQTQTRSYAAISGSLVVGPGSALATTATDGFLYLPSCAGTPTGAPTANTGALAHAYDSTNDELEIYSNGQWNGIPVSGGINTAPAGNVTLRSNYSLVVIDAYTIAAAATLTLGAGSRMRMI